jgi:Fungalysin metallopeptidase (M36)/FG-GAP-like repeat
MAREFDSRDHGVNRATDERLIELQQNAGEISQQLTGEHRVLVESIDSRTGNASTVSSIGAPPVGDDLVAAAVQHLQSIQPVLGLTTAVPVEFRPDPSVAETSSGAAAVHLQQTVHDIPVFQAAQTVRFTSDRAIEATAGTYFSPASVTDAAPSIDALAAVTAAAQQLAEPDGGKATVDQFGEPIIESPVSLTGFKPSVVSTSGDPELHTVVHAPPFSDPIEASLTWFDIDTTLRLSWEIVIGLPDGGDHYRVMVDGHTGKVLYSHRITASVAARANVALPDAGSARQLRDLPLALATYPVPTPVGLPAPFPRTDWVAVDRTEGNNVRAHLNAGDTATGAAIGGVMTFNPTDASGNDQLRVTLFFYCNFMHDFLYLLGFREADGNFQQDNGTRGGTANDRVDSFVFPGAVSGTANMFTPADGTSPTMNMGLVTSTGRHTALDSSVVFHEFTHGLSNRLVGGRTNTHALDAIQSGSMGEGWSDYVACTINGTTVVGNWVLNNAAGIRGFPYDSNFPDNFGMLGTGRYNEVHNNGEIWCASLMELNRRIGAALAIQVVVDGLKLTPANPTYLQARDAILAALENKARAERWSGNVHRKRLHQAWRAFAKFGMGFRARSGASTGTAGIVADFTVPRISQRSGLEEGGSQADLLVSSPWGVGVLKLSGSTLAAPMMAPNGTRFGGWLVNTSDNDLGPVADYDGDGKSEVLVSSPWGVGVWKLSGTTMTAPMMKPNGTRFGGWLLNTADNDMGPVANYEGGGVAEVLVSSPWGVGIWKLSGSTMTATTMSPNGTRFGGWLLNTRDNDMGPAADYDGDGVAEVLVSSPWGVGVWKLSGATLTAPMLAPNGTRFGGWLLNTADNTFGPVCDLDGDGHAEIVVSSPWGVGVWKLAGTTFSTPMMAANGTRFGGWLLNTADNTIGPVGDFDGDGKAEILVSSPWGVGVWKLAGGTFNVLMMAPNGTRFGGWLLNTLDNKLGPVADYDGDGKAEIFVSSPWGVGIWKLAAAAFDVPMMAPNGTRFGGWLLNTADNVFGFTG